MIQRNIILFWWHRIFKSSTPPSYQRPYSFLEFLQTHILIELVYYRFYTIWDVLTDWLRFLRFSEHWAWSGLIVTEQLSPCGSSSSDKHHCGFSHLHYLTIYLSCTISMLWLLIQYVLCDRADGDISYFWPYSCPLGISEWSSYE